MKKARSRLLSSSRARNDSVIPGERGATVLVTTFSPRPEADAGEHQATEAFAQHQQPPPPRLIDPPRLLNKHEVTALIGRSYDWIWRAVNRGAFPPGRYVGQGLCWISIEIERWLANLPKQKLKPPEDADD